MEEYELTAEQEAQLDEITHDDIKEYRMWRAIKRGTITEPDYDPCDF